MAENQGENSQGINYRLHKPIRKPANEIRVRELMTIKGHSEQAARDIVANEVWSRVKAKINDRFSKQQQNTIERLSEISLIDPLTGLPNRRSLDGEDQDGILLSGILYREFEEANRSGKPVSLMFIDGDMFKVINDTLGHKAGDKTLQIIARTLVDNIRENDTPFRYGGEEFVIVCPGGGEEAKTIAERIRLAINSNHSFPKDNTTVSIGVSTYNPEQDKKLAKGVLHEMARSYLQKADDAVFKAKENGRNRVEVWDQNTPAKPKTAQPSKVDVSPKG